jgi:hypothetical protein
MTGEAHGTQKGVVRGNGTADRFLTWSNQEHALRLVTSCPALSQVEGALRAAYDLTASSPRGRLHPASVMEKQLKERGWRKCRVWAPEPIVSGESFDGWNAFPDESGRRFGVAVEVEWNWERVYFDMLKMWRGREGGQLAVGIIVLRGPSSLRYAIERQYASLEKLFCEVPLVFAALDAPDLHERDYEVKARKVTYPMP